MGIKKILFIFPLLMGFSTNSTASWVVTVQPWSDGGAVTRLELPSSPSLAQIAVAKLDRDAQGNVLPIFATAFLRDKQMCDQGSHLPNYIGVGRLNVAVKGSCESIRGRSYAIFSPIDTKQIEDIFVLFKSKSSVTLSIGEMHADISAMGFTRELNAFMRKTQDADELAVIEAVPDAYEILGDPEFEEWLNVQPPGVKRLFDSNDPQDAIYLLKQFKEHKQNPRAGDELSHVHGALDTI